MGELVLRTGTHLGGGDSGTADLCVLRHRGTGLPLLTGSSLAGALRSHLSDRLTGYFSDEPSEVAALFGSPSGDDTGGQGPLVVYDTLGDAPAVEIRDGVALGSATGLAADHKKFDAEVLAAGTRFPIRIDLLVAGEDHERTTLPLLAAALSGLTDGDVRLGARTSRGLGACTVENWRAHRFTLADEDGWMQWLAADATNPVAHVEPTPDIVTACELERELLPGDNRRRAVLDANLELAAELLIRSPSLRGDGPDVAHLRSGGDPVMTGTGAAGAMRAQAARIGHLLGGQNTAQWIDSLFGPQLGAGSEDSDARASRVRVDEATILGSSARTTRTAIDPFTSGVRRSALYQDEPLIAGTFTLRLEIRNPDDADVGLILLVIKDLLDGNLALGGTTSIGRGVMRGSATLRWDNNTIHLHPGGEGMSNDHLVTVDTLISAVGAPHSDAAHPPSQPSRVAS